jgi:hypothetical protein
MGQKLPRDLIRGATAFAREAGAGFARRRHRLGPLPQKKEAASDGDLNRRLVLRYRFSSIATHRYSSAMVAAVATSAGRCCRTASRTAAGRCGSVICLAATTAEDDEADNYH